MSRTSVALLYSARIGRQSILVDPLRSKPDTAMVVALYMRPYLIQRTSEMNMPTASDEVVIANTAENLWQYDL